MPRPLPVVQITSLAGGVNKLVSPTRTKDNESPDLLNIEFTEDGLPSKRRGCVLNGDSTSGRITGLGSLYKVGSVRKQLRVKGTKLQEKINGTWTDVSGVALESANVNFCQSKDALYIFDGGVIKKYDNTSLTAVTAAPKASYGINYGSRVVSAGDPDNPSRLNFSVPDNPDGYGGSEGTASAGSTTTITDSTKTWATNQFAGFSVYISKGTNAGQSRIIVSNTATQLTVSVAYGSAIDTTSEYSVAGGDTLDISKDDGQIMMGLGKFEEKLLCFKERSTYQLTFDSEGFPVVQQISNFVGCVSHRTIDSVENDIFYLSNDGVRTFGYVPNMPQIIRTNKLSSKIESEIQNINSTYYSEACAIYFDNKYILSVPNGSSTINNRLLVFQLLYGCWTIWNGWNVNCFNEFIDTDNRIKLYFGDESTASVFEALTGYNDNGTAINAYWFSKQFDLGRFSTFKKMNFVDIQIRSLTGSLGVDVITDGNKVSKSTTISSTFSAKDGLRNFMLREAMLRQDVGSTVGSTVTTDDVRRIKITKKIRTIQVKVYNNNLDESFTLMSFAFGARQKSPKSFDSSKIIR